MINCKDDEPMKSRPQYVDQDYYLVALLSQARHALFKVRKKELRQYNIHVRQATVLAAIWAIGDKATPGQIARWLFLEPHSTSGLLKRMEKQGLVRKTKDLHKKNLVRITVTEKGRQAYYQASKRELTHKIMSILSEEEHQQLRVGLERLRDKAIEELGVPKPLSPPPQLAQQ